MYPIIEFDPSLDVIIDPSHHYKRIEGAEYCVLCFFKEVIDKVVTEQNAQVIGSLKSEMGEHPLYQINHKGKNITFFLSGVGAPLAAGLFEEVIAYGFSKFVACGCAGVLDKNIQCGKIVIPNAAVRDEGTSYHYAPPSREIEISNHATSILANELKKQGIDYLIGKTWTTDGFYRETKTRIEKRKSEGCITVEMECAAFSAVASFRNVVFGQYLYGGDDISGSNWDPREWKKVSIREHLFWTAIEACLKL